MKKNILYAVLLLLVVFAVPQILSDFGTNLTTEIFIMAMFAMSLGLIMGYAGLDSLGHAAFFGIGAYSVALIGKFVTNTYLIIIIAVAIAGLIAFITGAVFIRTSKFYFLMITLAFSQLIFTLLWQMKDLTGGADGMSVSAIMNLGFGDIFDPQTMYYVMGIIFVAVFILLRLFVESPAGKITKGVMENEGRMAALGYDVRVYKLLAFTLSGALAGFAGSLYSFYNVFVSPELSAWLFSGQVMIMVIVGGVGTLLGPAIGAGVFIFLQNFISTYTERWPLILGAILIFLVLIGKGGIIQWLKLGVDMIFKSKPKNNKVPSTIQPEKEEIIS